MGTFFSEPGWLCLTVTALLGGTILCKLKTSPGQVGRKVVCLAGLWGGAYLISLSLFWGLVLFSLLYFVMYTYFSGQELLPVDQKAVLITGKWTALLRAGTGPCFALAGLFFRLGLKRIYLAWSKCKHNPSVFYYNDLICFL